MICCNEILTTYFSLCVRDIGNTLELGGENVSLRFFPLKISKESVIFCFLLGVSFIF